jgi:hypothetical protein
MAKTGKTLSRKEPNPELFRQYLEAKLPDTFSRSELYEALDRSMFTPKSMMNFAARGVGPDYFYVGAKTMYEKKSFIEWAMERYGRKQRDDYARNCSGPFARQDGKAESGEAGAGAEGAGD